MKPVALAKLGVGLLPQDKEITIYDIAREAGVSPATVSRVLTNNTRVSEEKRQLVQGIIDKYHFRPNQAARRLGDGASKLLGILVADIRNPYYALLVVECEQAARQRGYSVMVCNALGDPLVEDSNLEMLYDQRVDAIILIGCRSDEAVADPAYVARVNTIAKVTPFITTGRLEGASCYRVAVDDVAGIDLVMEHLAGLGHKKIAFITGRNSVYATGVKVQRYLYLLGRLGLAHRPEYLQESNYSAETGFACANALLSLPEPPTAIIAANDFVALGVVDAAACRGFAIPGDISLVSYDNTYLAEAVTPKLTSIDYDYPAFGTALIEMATGAIQQRETERERILAPALVVRSSSGTVKK